MTKRKATKRALFLSFVSMFLCFTMLLGTTYAWFTDSVTSAVNTITAGNLDVELYHENKGTNGVSVEVDESIPLFTDVDSSKWEPGAMAWEKFTVKNAGNLSLKYKLQLNAFDASTVLDENGEELSFSKMLKAAVVAPDFVFNRDNVKNIDARDWVAIDSVLPIFNSTILEEGDSESFGIVIWWMPTDRDNLFNMNNDHRLNNEKISVNIGVNLFATQIEDENDSFGPDYDMGLELPSTGMATFAPNASEPMSIKAGNATVTIPVGADAGVYTLKTSDVEKTVDGYDVTLSMDIELLKDGAKIAAANGISYTVEYYIGSGNSISSVTHKGADITANTSYDSAKGIVTMSVSSFCPFTITYVPSVIYDEGATFPMAKVDFATTETVTEKVDDSGAVKEEVALGAEESEISAKVPEGVKLAENATSLELSVKTVTDENSQANVVLEEGEEAMSIDVHIEGVAEDNKVPMKVTLKGLLKKALNDSNFKLFHVENGETVAMTLVPLAELDAHNEFYYDAVTGDVTLCLASFSQIAIVSDEVVHWDGVSATSFNNANITNETGTEADPWIIANAGQLAYFRDIVDGKAEWTGDRTFNGQFVKLANNIFLNHEGEFKNNFDPIGWGYSYAPHNRDGVDGKVFKGTFDGDRYAIHGLWQNGWGLEDPDNDGKQDADYTYTNCGGGLFASVENATIKNLVMIDAIVTFECVEAGIVVGLAQGSCNFESIFIYDSKIANYQRPAGGVVGEISPSRNADGTAISCNFNFTKIMLDTSVVVGSLWGDFDTPVGGIIGARWDDEGVSMVNMTTCDIACELDVYNDVTSTYQWYAYRRAGMLIGNTDTPPADGKNSKVASATFLTCDDVDVYYTNWTKYNYCQFSNHNSNWPWVRVQAGENCEAYSNPRYGVPNDANGNKVTGYDHVHTDGDQCNVQIYFNQLYGGGQGVYGQPEHDGVNTDVKYLVTFMHDDHVAGIKFIEDADIGANGYQVEFPAFADLPHFDNTKNYTWLDSTGREVVDIDGNIVTDKDKNSLSLIPVNNQRDIFYYINRTDKYYVHFVDKDGFYVAELEFYPNTGKFVEGAVVPNVPEVPGYYGVWEEYETKMKDATSDLIINAVYSKVTINVVMEDADALFRLLEDGKHVAMSQDLSGDFGNAGKRIFCNITSGKDSRVDINSFTLSYDGASNAGNKTWTLFQIQNGAKLTVGDGFAGFGVILFDMNQLGNGSTACVFNVVKGGTLVIERGIEIELRYPVRGEVTLFQGVDLDEYPSLTVKHSTSEEDSANGYSYVKIIATERTVIAGEGSIQK